MRKRLYPGLIVISFLFLGLSCKSLVSTPFISPFPAPSTNALISPLPHSPPAITEVIVPTPRQEYGIVRGRIMVESNVNMVIGELFLAESVQTSDPNIRVPALDIDHAPKAYFQRQTGDFIFTDVPPGTYGLVVWEPFNSFLVDDPETGGTLFISVKANDILDLGELSLP